MRYRCCRLQYLQWGLYVNHALDVWLFFFIAIPSRQSATSYENMSRHALKNHSSLTCMNWNNKGYHHEIVNAGCTCVFAGCFWMGNISDVVIAEIKNSLAAPDGHQSTQWRQPSAGTVTPWFDHGRSLKGTRRKRPGIDVLGMFSCGG